LTARVRSGLLAVASGLLLAFALPQAIPWISLDELDPAGHLEWLAWFGLVPALFALDLARSGRQAALVGLLSGLAYFFASIWWVNHAMTSFGGVPFPLALLGLTLLVLFMAAHWALAFFCSFTIRARLGWPLFVHLPAVWAGTELLRNYLFTGFPWGNLGYLQARHPTVAQLASVTGIYGIAALLVAVNTGLYALLASLRRRTPFPKRTVAALGVLLLAALAYGRVHLEGVRARSRLAPRLKVGLVQGNVNQSVKNAHMTYAEYILGRYLPLTLEADRRGADLVAWPEASYPWLVPSGMASFADPRAGLSPLSRAHLLLGAGTVLERRGPGGARVGSGANTLFLLRPDLSVEGTYSKHHLVPFGEYVPGLVQGLLRSVVPEMVQQVPGRTLRVLSFAPEKGASPVRLAPMICYDAIFPEVNVDFAREDPDLLVNPTNDAWYGYSSGPYQFLAMVRMRAIEVEKAVARPAYAGISAFIDPTGEVLPGALPVGPVDPELAPDPDEPPRLLLGEVPLLRGRTLYTRFGDLFAWAASAYGALVLGFALLPRARTRPKRQGTVA